jgi:membrane peptidoglycan carboxypeptidase
MHGPLGDPAALAITPRLRFAPEPSVVAALSYLRAPFTYRPAGAPGVVVELRDGAPDFIPIDAVPPLFQKALLVSEDAGFSGHAGIDLVEIVAAWVENGEDGRRLRGASTITQQVVKNLLLSSERTYGRKLKEAALALMVDAVVPKSRLLEIYVNIVEWGPRLYGLVPAARHYFGKRPDQLTPKEMAFLVCLIPSPVRYHQAHGAGKIGPGMEHLVRNLLAKLRSVDAIGEEEYQQALAEDLAFVPEGAEPTSGA